jgi:hypothetical protein
VTNIEALNRLRTEFVRLADAEPHAAERRSPRPRRIQPRLLASIGIAVCGAVVFAVAVSLVVLRGGGSGESAVVGFAPARNWQSAERPVVGGSSSPVQVVAAFQRPKLGVITSSSKPPDWNPSARRLPPDGILIRVILPARLVHRALEADVPRFAKWGSATIGRITGKHSIVTEYQLPGMWGHFRIRVDVYIANPRPTTAQRAAARAELARITVRPR